MAEPLKAIYNKEFLYQFGRKIREAYSAFDIEGFVAAVLGNDWDILELKARIRRICLSLGKYLPQKYEEALNVLFKIDEECIGFPYLFFPDFVEVYGQNQEHWELSMKALERFTQRSSAEFAVRPFLIRDPERMMRQMNAWVKHPNEHVRRLASEGCRPSLPWGQALPQFKEDPAPILPVLEQLKMDSSLYVRKSVANNLNDISKTHPELVIQIALDWYGKHEYTDWIVKHACRTLLKKGDKRVLSIFGYKDDESIQFLHFTCSPDSISIGEEIRFSFQVKSEKRTKIRIEYAIDYVKAKGHRSKKVFQITETEITSGEIKSYARKHSFKDLTTRKHYEGVHSLSIIVNGTVKNSFDFIVK